MTTRFPADLELLAEAARLLSPYKRLYWIIGGAASGKTTLSRLISERSGMDRYDIDEHSFGDYAPRFTAERHPATYAWYTADNPFAWMLSHEWDEFSAVYKANNVETLDLFAADVAANCDPDLPLLVDGGITHPSVLGQVVAAERILCLAVSEGESARAWETDPDRIPMKEMTLALPDGEAAWQRFLDYDQRMHELCVDESRAAGIAVLKRAKGATADQMAARIADLWGLS